MKTNKVKGIAFLLVLSTLIFGQISPTFAASKTLMNSIAPQAQSNWCWAAVAAASGQYWFSVNEYVVCDRNQYDAYYHIYGDYSNQTAYIYDIANAMNYVAHDYGDPDYSSSALSDFSTLKAFINSNKPIPAICLPGHALLIVGYNDTNETVYYCDPANGAKGEVNFTYFKTNTSWYRWTNTAFWGSTWNG